jgi:L-fucose/D-arabinose isomerase
MTGYVGFEEFDATTTERLCRASTFEWPHAFARFDASAEEMLGRFGAEPYSCGAGDRVAELRAVCPLLDVDFDGFGALE